MLSSVVSIKKRDPSIDILKGILIIFLVIHHSSDLGNVLGIDSVALRFVAIIQRPLALCYFMQAFFLITGFCSNFEKPAKDFIINQIKLLLVPSVVFTLLFGMTSLDGLKNSALQVLRGGAFWFLTAMLWGKIIYYVMHKKIQNKNLLLGILVLFSFGGTLLNDIDLFKNYYWHRQILDLTLFIAIGNIFKKQLVNKKLGWICLGLYATVCMVCFAIYGVKIPYVTAGFGTSAGVWLFHVILAVCGSVAVLNLCKLIKSSKILEYAGKQSLIIYVFHIHFLRIMFNGFSLLLNNAGGVGSFAYTAIIVSSTVLNCLFIAYVIENTKLKILFGRR